MSRSAICRIRVHDKGVSASSVVPGLQLVSQRPIGMSPMGAVFSQEEGGQVAGVDGGGRITGADSIWQEEEHE